MKKYMLLAILTVLCVVTGCGGKEEVIGTELAQQLSESSLFTEKLEAINSDNAEKRYGFNSKDYSEITAFVGTKSNCDEFVVIKTSDTENVKSILGEYLKDKQKAYEEYRPDEVYKLTRPFITEHNGAVIMIISHDKGEAEDEYNNYIKN